MTNPNDASDDSALQYAYSWIDGNTTEDPPVTQTIPVTVMRMMGYRAASAVVMLMEISASLEFALSLRLWKYTPLRESNVPGEGPKPGKPMKMFACSTEQTRLIAPKIIVDPATQKMADSFLGGEIVGPFIESVNVQMWFDDQAHAILKTRAPDTDQQSGETSSSVSYSFSGGFFGADLTASLSATYSNSVTMNLTDYIIKSSSDLAKTNHTVLMEMMGNGGRYLSAQSLADTASITGWAANNNMLPARATSDQTFAMQGVWELPGDSEEDVFLNVLVTATFPVVPSHGVPKFTVGPSDRVPLEALGKERFVTDANEYNALMAKQAHTPEDGRFVMTWTRRVKVPLSIVEQPNKNSGDGQ